MGIRRGSGRVELVEVAFGILCHGKQNKHEDVLHEVRVVTCGGRDCGVQRCGAQVAGATAESMSARTPLQRLVFRTPSSRG